MKNKKKFIMTIPIIIAIFVALYINNIKYRSTEKPSATPILTVEPSVIAEPSPSEKLYELTDDEMEYADDEAFKILKEEYGKIDFYGKFEKGNIEDYDLYIEKFEQLLKNEKPFTNPKTNETLFISQFEEMIAHVSPEKRIFDVNDYIFRFFDMDGDGAPELCITDNTRFTYVFKYLDDSDNFILWCGLGSTWNRLNGTRRFRWDHYGLGDDYALHCLYENAEKEWRVVFYRRDDFSKKTYRRESWYMVSLPEYADKEKQIKLPAEIEEQYYLSDAYIRSSYFRVTEEQFDELTKDYFDAAEKAEEDIKEVTYTYEELFGN